MSGDPYIKENERLEAEIARLQESVNYLQIADNHHQELMAEKEEEIDRLRAELEIARQSDTDYQAHIENAKLQIELKKEEQFTKALQIELEREEKFTMAAMDKAKLYQAALAQAQTLILSANALMPNHGLLAEEWDSWRRDADKWLAKEGK